MAIIARIVNQSQLDFDFRERFAGQYNMCFMEDPDQGMDVLRIFLPEHTAETIAEWCGDSGFSVLDQTLFSEFEIEVRLSNKDQTAVEPLFTEAQFVLRCEDYKITVPVSVQNRLYEVYKELGTKVVLRTHKQHAVFEIDDAEDVITECHKDDPHATHIILNASFASPPPKKKKKAAEEAPTPQQAPLVAHYFIADEFRHTPILATEVPKDWMPLMDIFGKPFALACKGVIFMLSSASVYSAAWQNIFLVRIHAFIKGEYETLLQFEAEQHKEMQSKNFLNFVEQQQEVLTKQAQKNYDETIRHIQQHYTEIANYTARLQEHSAMLIGGKEMAKTRKTELTAQLGSLGGHPFLERFEVDTKQALLHFYTKPIITQAPKQKEKYKIGRLKISISPLTPQGEITHAAASGITIENLDRPDAHQQAPHVRGGKPCLGTAAQGVYEMLYRMDFLGLLDYFQAYFETFDPGDGWARATPELFERVSE